jgi:hypothetical protein
VTMCGRTTGVWRVRCRADEKSGDESPGPGAAGRVGLPVSSRTSAHVASETAVQDARWTFGGGTVLMLRIAHRHSKDIDLFVPDPQYLGFVNPRLSDAAESISADYEEAAEYIKLFLARGDRRGGWNVADRNSIRNDRLSRRMIRVETSAEIIAKKMWRSWRSRQRTRSLCPVRRRARRARATANSYAIYGSARRSVSASVG